MSKYQTSTTTELKPISNETIQKAIKLLKELPPIVTRFNCSKIGFEKLKKDLEKNIGKADIKPIVEIGFGTEIRVVDYLEDDELEMEYSDNTTKILKIS